MTNTTAATTATTERRARPRHTPACRADRCGQGRHACPCPQACELPDPTDATAETPGTTAELIGFATWLAGIAAAIVFVLISGSSA